MAKEIGQLNVKIGLDSTGFQNGISSLNRKMRKVNKIIEMLKFKTRDEMAKEFNYKNYKSLCTYKGMPYRD